MLLFSSDTEAAEASVEFDLPPPVLGYMLCIVYFLFVYFLFLFVCFLLVLGYAMCVLKGNVCACIVLHSNSYVSFCLGYTRSHTCLDACLHILVDLRLFSDFCLF